MNGGDSNSCPNACPAGSYRSTPGGYGSSDISNTGCSYCRPGIYIYNILYIVYTTLYSIYHIILYTLYCIKYAELHYTI